MSGSKKTSDFQSKCDLIRSRIRESRKEAADCLKKHDSGGFNWYSGLMRGMGSALRLILAIPSKNEGTCPDCAIGLPGDGSCCDLYGWVRDEDSK